MKRFILFFAFITIFCGVYAQQRIKLSKAEMLTLDTYARRHKVMDRSGEPCAMLRVTGPLLKGMTFDTLQVVKCIPQVGEYLLYVSANPRASIKSLKFGHPKYGAGAIELPQEILPFKEQTVYRIYLEVPDLNVTYDELLAEAIEYDDDYPLHTESVYFLAAANAYEAASKHKDCPLDKKDDLQRQANRMLNIRKAIYKVERCGELAQDLEQKYGFTHDSVYLYLQAKYKNLDRVIISYPEIKSLTPLRDEAWNQLQQHPNSKKTETITVMEKRQTITGKVTRTSDSDIPLSSLGIYASQREDVSKKEARYSAVTIGKVNADGTFSVIMPDDYSYIYVSGEKKAHYISPEMTTLNINL